MKTREQFRAEVKQYYREHPEKEPMKAILIKAAKHRIDYEMYFMAQDGVPEEIIKTHVDKRVNEIKELLGYEEDIELK